MSRWGVGPIFALLSIGYAMATLALTWAFHPVFRMEAVPYRIGAIAAVFLLVIGISFFIASVIAVTRAYNANRLVTSGPFGCCRHPLYASWVVFIVPGIALLVHSWIGLTTPLFMFAVLRMLVKKEERYLEAEFGDAYLKYKKQVPRMMPCGWMKKSV
jgi:protein-S-isoprenylcysteine O-methyltransferase Ste14